jgi:hypothetical protein
MMRRATLLAAFLAASAACDGASGSPGPDLRPQPRPAPVTLTTNAGHYSPGSKGVLHVRNEGGDELAHGVCPSLQREAGGTWVPVDPPPNTACIMLAVLLQPGQTYDLAFTAPLLPAVYRYALDFTRSGPGADPPDEPLRQTSNAFTVQP